MATKTETSHPTPDRDAAVAALTELWATHFDTQDPGASVDVVLAAAFPAKW